MKNHNRTLLASLLGLAPLLVSMPSLAVEVTENLCGPTQIDNAWKAGKIQLNLAAHVDTNQSDDGIAGLVLTSSSIGEDTGTAFYNSALTLGDEDLIGSERPLYNYFRMHMGPKGLYGLTSIIHNAPTGASAVGANGSGLGFGGIPNSVVWEFDNQTYGGPMDQAHLSLLFGAEFQNHLADANNLADVLGSNKFFSGQAVDVWIDYNHSMDPHFRIRLHVVGANSMNPLPNPNVASSKEMNWTVPENGINPAVLELTANAAVGLAGWLGFTSSRGAGVDANSHWISRWQFSNLGPPCGCGIGCEEPNAVCDPSGICVFQGCTTDADCGNDPLKARCDAAALDQSTNPPTRGICKPCIEDVNCQHITDPTRPYCLEQTVPEVNVCVECTQDSHCPSDSCDMSTHTCDACKVDADCPSVAEPRCNTSVVPVKCDICVEDANCARFMETPVCGAVAGKNPQKCVECNVDADCKNPALPACDSEDSNKCVACVTSDDCKNPELPVCDPGNNVCVKDRFVAGGGCGCSLPGDDNTATAAAVAALFAAAAGLSRRRRRS